MKIGTHTQAGGGGGGVQCFTTSIFVYLLFSNFKDTDI